MDVIAQVLEDVGAHGLFAAEGTAWRRQRRVVMPALSLPHVRQFFPILTAATTGLKTRWDQAARTGEVVDMPAELMRYTVEVITRVTFGDDLSHELAGLPQHLGQILALINRRIMAPPLARLAGPHAPGGSRRGAGHRHGADGAQHGAGPVSGARSTGPHGGHAPDHARGGPAGRAR